jgi:hypothetical protein
MAKRRKRRGHRTGSVITTRRLNGLGNLKQPASFTGAVVPPLVGGVVTGAATFATEYFTMSAAATPDTTQGMLHKYAPVVGMGIGGLASLALMATAGKPQALASFATSLAVGITMLVDNYLDANPMKGVGYMYRGRRQMGAVVAEQLHGLPARGVGALVMEPYGQQGYGNPGGGEKVSLGAINPGAFGTPGFDM